jgi:hypothetical protein
MLAGVPASAPAGSYKVYSTYLWHLEQPNYWPEKVSWENRTTFAYEHLSGSPAYPGHPENNIAEIFGKDDRTAVYQYRARDTVNALRYLPDAGAQLSYSGGLIENVKSLGDHYSTGYGPNWHSAIREGVQWTTSRGRRRLEPLGFAYHHALAPLVDRDALRKEIAVNKDIWWKTWLGYDYTSSQPHPKGFRCSEEAFSVRIVKDLVQAGYEWVIVPNHHLSRTHPNYVQLHGKGLYDPPNRADRINPDNGGGWYSGEIDGRGSTESIPFSFQAHRVRYVDPESGTEYRIIVVPMTDLGSYRDGYSQQGIEILNALNAHASHGQPCLALFSHDGDNAWGGGYSYYMEAVPSFASQASGAGYRPTTIQTFLDENPPPANDVVHVEDGAWFNAADDWGHPQFWNWLWYPQRDRTSPAYRYNDPSTYADIENGWAEDFRNWAVIVAAQNHVSTAEQIELAFGSHRVDSWRIQDPVAGAANNAELAWHFFLPGLNSGYMYYGTAIDMEVKPTLACNQAVQYANYVIAGHEAQDATGPTVFVPQRYPYNPGGTNYGSAYGYRAWVAPSDFHVWTFAYDVAGVTSVVLKVRADKGGDNPLTDDDNETYAGGPSVEAWQTLAMNKRPGSAFAGNIFNDPQINFFIMPTKIADEYWVKVTGYNNQLLDYYVEARDGLGNLRKTDIQHVHVGSAGGGAPVVFSPAAPTGADNLATTYNPAGRALDGVAPVYLVITFDAWVSSNAFEMASNAANRTWSFTNAIPVGATNATVYFRNAAGTVTDQNGGARWSVAITPGQTNVPSSVEFLPPAPSGCGDVTVVYKPGTGPLKGATNVCIHAGRNGWYDVITPDPSMTADGTNWTYVYRPAPETVQINCVFNNGQGVWDNNSGRDWAVDVINCGGGVTASVWFAEGSPAVSSDPPDAGHQNNTGDAFDFSLAGWDAVTVRQGGFGSFGHVYFNYDTTNFYVGATGCSPGASNNAMVVFLAFDTLADNQTNLWALNGPPLGLDRLHNVEFDPPMDIALLLGDEHGDGTFSNFSLGDGSDFGQGVFYLSRPSGTFAPVAGARLSQFDGASTNAVASADDDGDRLAERWECAIPWASLGAPGGITNIGSCHAAGLLVNTSTGGPQGLDRYISGNYLGFTASSTNALDANMNFGFSFVNLSGFAVGLPDQDTDGDGLPDVFEIRYFGGPTNAAPGDDSDGDLFTNGQELRLGTHPRSSASRLDITDLSVTGAWPVVSWQTVGGKSYRVEVSTNLMGQGGGFTQAVEVTENGVPGGVGAVRSYTNSAGPFSNDWQHFRIRLAP